MWSTTSKAFWLSTVTKNRGSIVRYFPMNMDNYRGIAVTPVISKLFEYAILPTLAENFTQECWFPAHLHIHTFAV
jgi:hypothetical protein